MIPRALINEPPLLVLPTLAAEIGLNEAIILNQMHYWQTNKNNKNNFDGRVWARNTYQEWQKEFPFWGKNTIVRGIDNLHEQRLILSYMEQAGCRKQKYYAVDYEVLKQVPGLKASDAIFNIPSDKLANQSADIADMDLPKMGRSMETFSYRERKGDKSTKNEVVRHGNLDTDQPSPKIVNGLEKTENSPSPEPLSAAVFIDRAVSGSELAENGNFDLPNLGRSSTRNGYIHLPNMGKSYKEAETTFRDINILPPPNPPQLQASEKDEELNQIRLKESGQASNSGSNHFKASDPSTGPSQLKNLDESESLSQKMIKIWNLKVQPKIKDAPRHELALTDSREKDLKAFFEVVLNSSFSEWERYCLQISRTHFLLGENQSGFKINLEWALNSANAMKVLEGRLYDKPKIKTQELKKLPQGNLKAELRDHFAQNSFPMEWLKVYELLCSQKGPFFYQNWLKKCEPQPVVDNKALLLTPTRFMLDHMTTHYLSDIKLAAHACWADLKHLTIEEIS
jgi:hypothetical protein